jgi:hypothetical protein
MLAEVQKTAEFINLLRAASKGRDTADGYGFLGAQELRNLSTSDHAYNPLEYRDPGFDAIKHFVMKRAFTTLLGAEIDWERIKREAAKLVEEIEEIRVAPEQAREATRWIPLNECNRIFDYIGWVSAWSLGYLEKLLGYFAEEAVFEDRTFGWMAGGKAELRGLFSDLFHSWGLGMRVRLASSAPSTGEVNPDWTRVGNRMRCNGDTVLELSGAQLSGNTRLLIQFGKFCRCTDTWSTSELERVIGNCVGFKDHRTPMTVVNTQAAVIINGIRVPKAAR